jgi:hypothetical protein
MPAARHLVGCDRCRALRNEKYSIQGEAPGPACRPFRASVGTTAAPHAVPRPLSSPIDKRRQDGVRCTLRSDAQAFVRVEAFGAEVTSTSALKRIVASTDQERHCLGQSCGAARPAWRHVPRPDGYPAIMWRCSPAGASGLREMPS